MENLPRYFNPVRENILNLFHQSMGEDIEENWEDEKYRKSYYRFLYESDSYAIAIPDESQKILIELITNNYPINSPLVAYDIGSSLGSWSKTKSSPLSKLKNINSILFEANDEVEFLYKENDWKYHIGLLGEEDGKIVKYHYNYENLGGNSRYLENNLTFRDNAKVKNLKIETLDTIVKNRQFPLPHIMKLDVQGSELDILKGADMCLNHAEILVVEGQRINFNEGAPMFNELLDFAISKGFVLWKGDVSPQLVDGDYFLIKSDLLVKNINTDSIETKQFIEKTIEIIGQEYPELKDLFYTFNDNQTKLDMSVIRNAFQRKFLIDENKLQVMELEYFIHDYNYTRANERCVEVALAKTFIEKYPQYTEIGAVMPYYGKRATRVIDCFDEEGDDNRRLSECDIRGHNILSISTLEHFGNEDYGNDKLSDLEGLGGLMQILTTAQNYLITIPIGCNPVFDKHILHLLPYLNCYGFKRETANPFMWEMVKDITHLNYEYIGEIIHTSQGGRYGANFILVITSDPIPDEIIFKNN